MDFAGAALDVSTRTVRRCAITVEFLSPLPRRLQGSTADAFIIPQISEVTRGYSIAAAELECAAAAQVDPAKIETTARHPQQGGLILPGSRATMKL